MFNEIHQCRICGNKELVPLLNLGHQYLTGVFPKKIEPQLTCGPLELVKCREDDAGKSCGLVQLRHSYRQEELYGFNYGYRSGLNQSMVVHLNETVAWISSRISLNPGDAVLDIGSNDGTLLKAYRQPGVLRIGMDPTAAKFKDFYPSDIKVVPEFFSAAGFNAAMGPVKLKVITSFAMFYDIEAPLDFMRQIASILAKDGVWVFEQSYMPTMVHENAYDTICHEHIEYYRLKQIVWMAKAAGLKIIDLDFNAVNGGSFVLMVSRQDAVYPECTDRIDHVLDRELMQGFHQEKIYAVFAKRVEEHRHALKARLEALNKEGKKVLGYGASTKGNVILQWCGLTVQDIPMIADVNEDKFGALTPGTWIPIVDEATAKQARPDYFLVLPWHFRDNLIGREHLFLHNGGKMMFPLPQIDIVAREKSNVS